MRYKAVWHSVLSLYSLTKFLPCAAINCSIGARFQQVNFVPIAIGSKAFSKANRPRF